MFLLLTLTGVSTKIAEAISAELKIGVQCGIGFFIAFIGLKNAGLVVDLPATFVTIGDLSQPAVMLALAGILLTVVMMMKNVKGGILISIILLTIAGAFVPVQDGQLTPSPEAIISWPEPITVIPGWQWTSGTQSSTSPVTSYVESAAGASVGGRTGLTAFVVAVCFIAALFLTPLMKVIPLMATTPAFLMVGILTMDSNRQLDFDDLGALATASVALLAMPFTFSISEGIALGFITYVGVMLGRGRYRQVSALTYILAGIFLLRYFF